MKTTVKEYLFVDGQLVDSSDTTMLAPGCNSGGGDSSSNSQRRSDHGSSFECGHCSARFAYFANFLRHQEICLERQRLQQQQLKHHNQMMTSTSASATTSNFKRSATLPRNFQSSSLLSSSFKCDKCPLQFKSHRSLSHHKTYAHTVENYTMPRRYVCENCLISFTNSYDLTKHKRTHQRTSATDLLLSSSLSIEKNHNPDRATVKIVTSSGLNANANANANSPPPSNNNKPAVKFADEPIVEQEEEIVEVVHKISPKVFPFNFHSTEAIPHTFLSGRIESHLKTFLHERISPFSNEAIDDSKIAVRVVSATKRSVDVTNGLVRELLGLPSTGPSRIECNAKTIFLFESFNGADVIIFALFALEFGDDDDDDDGNNLPLGCRRRAFVSNFATPSFLQGVNDSFHSELFCQFLHGYLSHCRAIGFDQVFVSSGIVASVDNVTEADLIFNGSDVLRFSSDWLLSVLDDAKRFGFISGYNPTTMAPNATCLPYFVIVDNDNGNGKMASRVERSAANLLKKCPCEWPLVIGINPADGDDDVHHMTRSPVSMVDVVCGEVFADCPFFVVHLQSEKALTSSLSRKMFEPDAVMFRRESQPNDYDDDDDGYLTSPRLFLDKCRLMEWQFGSLESAAVSTVMILRDVAARYASFGSTSKR